MSRQPATTKPPGRIRALQQAVRRTTLRVREHTVILGLIVVAVGAFMAYISWISINGVPFQSRYKLNAVVPASSPILKRGEAVRIAGRLAGFITNVQPYQHNERVEMELRPAYAPVGRDARTNVKVKSIVYLTYLEIYPGNVDNPLPSGGTIPLSRSTSGVDLLEVAQLFDRETRKTLKRAIVNTGYGVAGRGNETNAALADLPAATSEGTSELQAATSHPGAIGRLVQGASRTAHGLRGVRGDDPGALIGSASKVAGAVADRRDQLARSIDLLRPFEDQFLRVAPLANPVLDDTARLARTLDPPVRKLAAGLPAVNALLALGGALRTETHLISRATNPVLIAQIPLFVHLLPSIQSLLPFLHALNRAVAGVAPYSRDIARAGRGVVSATSRHYPEGQTAPGDPVLRFSPVFGCHTPRQPFPAPGETIHHSQSC